MNRFIHLSIAGLLLYAMFMGYRHYDPLLPPYVAQHFDGAGHANGFAKPEVFWGIGLAAVGVVFISTHVPALLLRFIPTRLFSLPNKHYWLSPPHREASIEYIENSVLIYGNFLLAWMGYVFWRVCEANIARGPLEGFGWGMLAMCVVTALWLVLLLTRFRVPR